jgi:putative membrane protein
MWGWMMGGAAPLGWLLWLVVGLLVVASLVVLLVLTWQHRSPSPEAGTAETRAPTPREILDQRYARGEIDHDDYIRRREELGRS